jgi:DNA-binding GntR family transcriptional regulator
MPKGSTAVTVRAAPHADAKTGKSPDGQAPDATASTVARLRQEVVDLILRGDIVPGKRLDQRQLAKRLQTTTAPLREAFSALESEGLLVREHGVGVFCRVYSVPELKDMVEIRGVLESLAARRAATVISEDEIVELRGLAAKLGSPIPTGGEREFVMTHVEFHKRIAEISRSSRLIALLEHYHLIGDVLANIAPKLWASEPHDHLSLVEAIASRDPEVAERAMRNHIAPTFEKRFAELRKRFGEGPILPFTPYRR